MRRAGGLLLLCAVVVLLGFPGTAAAARMGNPDVAALQVALRALGLYSGSIDGWAGPGTRSAVRSFQSRAGLAVDGIAGPATRAALGGRGRPAFASRTIAVGARGWDVAALQFRLAWQGFPSGPIDGGFGTRTEAALRRFQRWARIGADGVAGARTIVALRAPPRRSPFPLQQPVSGPRGDGFGPRGNRFHTGLDFPVPHGTTVRAARAGRVTWAGWSDGGWGNIVSIAHGSGYRTVYAHLSRTAVARGAWVGGGAVVGYVGSTGISTGPHLHFELRLRGASLDPATGLR